MSERRKAGGRRCVGLAKDSIKAQAKISAETERPDREDFAFEFPDAIVDRWTLISGRGCSRRLILDRCRARNVFLLADFLFIVRSFGRERFDDALLVCNDRAHFGERSTLLP